ncbi:MAG: energy transducer TonB [Thiobacillus sp.]|nr:energy transducer TonB [Thiobacillus sp.]
MEDDRKPAWVRWGGVAVGLVAAVLIALWLKDLLTPKGPVQKMKVQQITLVRPPPPPPPPPEQKPPEPEIEEEVKLDEPQPTPDEPQQADAPPPDGIAEGPEGGMATDIARGVPTLPGSGGRGNPWAWYDALVNDAVNSAVQTALSREKALKNKNYKVIVKIWIDGAGQVTRAALEDSTGDARADEVLKEALKGMRALRDSPPADMPQPMKIRVTSRA